MNSDYMYHYYVHPTENGMWGVWDIEKHFLRFVSNDKDQAIAKCKELNNGKR